MASYSFSRHRALKQSALGLGLLSGWGPGAAAASARKPAPVTPVPLSAVRLLPSAYADAVRANGAYLLRLSADRFLHNYHLFAGLPVKGALYGGWEADTIAGEGLGHYLSALSLMHAQTGQAVFRERVDYIVNELAAVQAAQGDGYVGGVKAPTLEAITTRGMPTCP